MTDLLDREALEKICGEIPIFPLPEVVFLPHSLLPLHVFEPRYRALVEDVLATSGVLAVPCLSPGWDSDYAGSPELLPICGVGQIIRHQGFGDGRCNIILYGLGRIRLEGDRISDRGYRIGCGRLLSEGVETTGKEELRKLHESLKMTVMQVLGRKSEWKEMMKALVEDIADPVKFMDKLAHMLLRSAEERQVYLELDHAVAKNDFLMAAVVELQILDPEVGA